MKPFANIAGAGAVIAVVIALSGCAVRAYPPVVGGYATVYADDVPVDIYAYPHVAYGNGYAYFARNRWYYPTSRGWVAFRNEPPALYRYRANRLRRPAPVRRFRGVERRAPNQFSSPRR